VILSNRILFEYGPISGAILALDANHPVSEHLGGKHNIAVAKRPFYDLAIRLAGGDALTELNGVVVYMKAPCTVLAVFAALLSYLHIQQSIRGFRGLGDFPTPYFHRARSLLCKVSFSGLCGVRHQVSRVSPDDAFMHSM
jgi:hypothetical protein